MEDRAVGLAAAAHAQLAEPAPRLPLRRRRPRRLHDDARGHLLHRALRRRRRRPGADRHHGHRATADVGRVRRHHRSGLLERADGRRWRPGPATSPICRGSSPTFRRSIDMVDARDVPQPGPTRRRWRARRRSVGDGHPARRRDPPFGPTGDAGRRRPRARPARLSGSRHPTLDGRHRHDGRALRRGRRHRQGAPAPVACRSSARPHGRRSISTP